MSLFLRNKIWWVYLGHGGRRIRRSTGLADRKAARRIHDELKARLWKQKKAGKFLSDALLLWVEERARSGTRLRELRQVRELLTDRPLVDVDEAAVLSAFAGKGPGTYNKLAGIVRASLRLAHRAGWREDVPHIARKDEPKGRLRWLTAEEWETLWNELPDHQKPMAWFALSTGLRWSNVAMLEWSRVDLKRKVAWVDAADAKAGKAIPVPLNADAIAALRATGEAREGYVFTYRGKPIQSAKTGFRGALKRAGLEDVTWHTLRHSWASYHAMNGTPLDMLQRLGGWATRSMVERYVHLTPGYAAQFAENAKPIGHNPRHTKVKSAA